MERNRTTYWHMHSHAESGNHRHSPIIPTHGRPASAFDLYRAIGVQVTGHEEWNSCYTDIATTIGIAKLISGEITCWEDIEAAESALQILFWHDRVDVIVPSFKLKDENFTMYTPCKTPITGEQTDVNYDSLIIDLFKPCVPHDIYYATEEIEVQGNIISKSNFHGSSVVGLDFEEAKNKYLEITTLYASIISSIPMELKVPAYFSSPFLVKFHGKRGFSGNFYRTIRKDWESAQSIIPDIEYNLRLPPLLSIVLDRANSRDSLPEIIQEMRAEMAQSRHEMHRFSEIVQGACGEAEIENRCQRIQESFDATFKASRQKKASRVFSILRLYKALKSPLETAMNALNQSYKISDPHLLASRTITGKMFSSYLATDSMHTLLGHFFTKSEIAALEKTKPKNT